MDLTKHATTLGHHLKQKWGERVHKVSINAAFTCPNRDGSKGIGGCTFCNNASFSPSDRKIVTPVEDQVLAGQQVIVKRTGAKKYLAYFQSYTNTYAEIEYLRELYESALNSPNVIGISVGTRPDCVPDAVLDLLQSYQQQGHEVWLELGLQSSFDASLDRVNRGHGFAEYVDAVKRARARGLQICTHLIAGLPGEKPEDTLVSLDKVLALGTDGLKIHPLHVVKGTQLAREWKRGEYHPMSQSEYVALVAEVIRRTPKSVVFHRFTGTASEELLLAPAWCSKKWVVLNEICTELETRARE
ncbi:TIGR01212 family radical SAM protein [Alkalimarinus coralli]|uniref:TIGR01212 family radical SAM protein n=1 Tax=Alkalimarinus coralli TaxID=2935863 RepID=UPI00202AC3A6|nr:TIGR01212 family radical SAM protein [Alkalimarinus coralli]